MVIRKREPWGVEVPRPPGLVTAGSDRELAVLVAAGTNQPIAVRGGDLHRTLGAPDHGRDRVRRIDMDLIRVELDDMTAIAVAHVIARRRGPFGWWRGPIVGVFNSEYLGRWDPAPRGHPNDGRFEVVEVGASMPLRARLQAWRRLPTGSHLPHPEITTSHRTEASWTFDRPADVYLDGERHRGVRQLRVTVEPDAYRLHV